MIKFAGSKTLSNNTVFLVFETDKGKRDEIPLDAKIANFILARLRNLDPPKTNQVERLNEDPEVVE